MIDGIKIQFKTEYLFCKICKEGLAVSGDSENVKERISIFKEDHAHKERAEKFEGGEKMETIKKILVIFILQYYHRFIENAIGNVCLENCATLNFHLHFFFLRRFYQLTLFIQ